MTQSDAIHAWLGEQFEAMVECLETLVNIDSHSGDKAGVDAVADALASWLSQADIDIERTPRAGAGDILLARVPGLKRRAGDVEAGSDTDTGHVLLMGHRDTVFPHGTVAERGFTRDGDTAFGPGVADMKAGLVLNLFVLCAIRRFGPLPFDVCALFTADEEIGSPDGRDFIERAAAGAQAVFNAEPARVSGNPVAARKGGGGFTIEVEGVAAHAGVSHGDGASAIEALARMVTRIHALTDDDAGVTTNVGLIEGGTARNTVAAHARAQLDVRYVTNEQRVDLLEALEEIVADSGVPGTSARLVQQAAFLPLERDMSAALLARYQRQCQALGFGVEGEFTGGCSDAGFTASLGVPTLCGTGPVGALMHTEREYCRLETLIPRARALAMTLQLLAEDDLA